MTGTKFGRLTKSLPKYSNKNIVIVSNLLIDYALNIISNTRISISFPLKLAQA